MENNEVQQTENNLIAPPTETANPTLEKLKLLGVVVVIFAFSLYATQSWKGDAGVPALVNYDFSLHSYSAWAIANQISHGNFFFDWDYKSNELLSRGRPILPYLITAPFVLLFGLFNGISIFVLFAYFLLGLGMYFLGKQLKLSTPVSLFMSGAMLLSYVLVIETNFEGGIHRLLTYALLPFLLICFFNKNKIRYYVGLTILLATIMLLHPLNGISFVIILLALFSFEVLESKDKNKQELVNFLLILIAAALLTISFFAPLIIEQASDAIMKPNYQIHGEKTLSDNKASVPEAFFDRTFGPTSHNGTQNKVFGYLGISIILLGLAGILFTPNKLRIPFLALTVFFYLTLTNPTFFPPILQAFHYARPLVMISFFLTIMAAFTVYKLTQSLEKSQILKIIAVILLFGIVFIDLSPGITAMPTSGLQFSKNVFSQVNLPDRLITTEMWISFSFSPSLPFNFIQFSEENVNPEYYSFVKNISTRNSNTITNNQFYLLDIVRAISIDFINAKVIVYDKNATKVFAPAKTILAKYGNLTESEAIFQNMLAYEWYQPRAIGVILPRGEVPQNNIDLMLALEKTKPNEVTLADLPILFNSTAQGKELPWRQTQKGETEILVNDPGWVFVSQMWYPHWRVNGKQVQEAGGGLIAFYADKPGEYTIYWERPWYDYVFLAISLITLFGLLYATINPEFFEKLLEKLGAKNAQI